MYTYAVNIGRYPRTVISSYFFFIIILISKFIRRVDKTAKKTIEYATDFPRIIDRQFMNALLSA